MSLYSNEKLLEFSMEIKIQITCNLLHYFDRTVNFVDLDLSRNKD